MNNLDPDHKDFSATVAEKILGWKWKIDTTISKEWWIKPNGKTFFGTLPDFLDSRWTGALMERLEEKLREIGCSHYDIRIQVTKCKSYDIYRHCMTFPCVSMLDDVRLALTVDGLDGANTNNVRLFNLALIQAIRAAKEGK